VTDLGRLPAWRDDRGTLVPVELADLDFVVRRVFTVVGLPGGVRRGDHRLTCRERIVLTGGRAEVETGPGPDGPFECQVLREPGQYLDVASGTWLRYRLADAGSAILVLADQPFESRVDR
jgi:hypothetical protein